MQSEIKSESLIIGSKIKVSLELDYKLKSARIYFPNIELPNENINELIDAIKHCNDLAKEKMK